MPQEILSIIIILLAAKFFGELAKRIGQPSVLGELIAGVMIGPGMLGWVREDQPLLLLGQLGAILLLFEVGLESDLSEFLRVGISAFLVAVIGVAGPFLLGYLLMLAFGFPAHIAIFVGATLTATSVGITARTLKDLRQINTSEARTILGAAVIDDVIALIILAVVGNIAAKNAVSFHYIAGITLLAVLFLSGSIALGIPLAPYLLRYTHRLGSKSLLTIVSIIFSLTLAFVADQLHLAMIVGAFAAGMILSRTEDTIHIQERIKPLADFLVPIFFVLLGTSVRLSALNPFDSANRMTLLLVLVLFVVAAVTKIASGLGVLSRGTSRLIVGIGMIPRGEVGLIFASTGLANKLITPEIYSAVVAVIALTTFLPPLLLRSLYPKTSEPICEECPS